MGFFDFYDDDSDWGAGLQSPNPRFPLGATVAITTTTTGQSTTGRHELIAGEEVGTVTRQGSGRILVRLDRRRTPVSVYLPTDLLEPLGEPEPVDSCRVVTVDGEPVRVLGGEPMDERSQDFFAEVVRAARRRLNEEKEPANKVHWAGDNPTSLHGNGSAAFVHSTRNVDDVTCRLCRVLLTRGEE